MLRRHTGSPPDEFNRRSRAGLEEGRGALRRHRRRTGAARLITLLAYLYYVAQYFLSHEYKFHKSILILYYPQFVIQGIYGETDKTDLAVDSVCITACQGALTS